MVSRSRMWCVVKDTDVNFLDDVCEGARLEGRKREGWIKEG